MIRTTVRRSAESPCAPSPLMARRRDAHRVQRHHGGTVATCVHIIRDGVYRKCAAYDKTDSLAVRAPRRHSRLHAVTLTEPP